MQRGLLFGGPPASGAQTNDLFGPPNPSFAALQNPSSSGSSSSTSILPSTDGSNDIPLSREERWKQKMAKRQAVNNPVPSQQSTVTNGPSITASHHDLPPSYPSVGYSNDQLTNYSSSSSSSSTNSSSQQGLTLADQLRNKHHNANTNIHSYSTNDSLANPSSSSSYVPSASPSSTTTTTASNTLLPNHIQLQPNWSSEQAYQQQFFPSIMNNNSIIAPSSSDIMVSSYGRISPMVLPTASVNVPPPIVKTIPNNFSNNHNSNKFDYLDNFTNQGSEPVQPRGTVQHSRAIESLPQPEANNFVPFKAQVVQASATDAQIGTQLEMQRKTDIPKDNGLRRHTDISNTPKNSDFGTESGLGILPTVSNKSIIDNNNRMVSSATNMSSIAYNQQKLQNKSQFQSQYAEELAKQAEFRKQQENLAKERERNEALSQRGLLAGEGGERDRGIAPNPRPRGGLMNSSNNNVASPPSTNYSSVPSTAPTNLTNNNYPPSSSNPTNTGFDLPSRVPSSSRLAVQSYAEELQRQMKEKEEKDRRAKVAEREAAKQTAGISDLIAAADHRGRERSTINSSNNNNSVGTYGNDRSMVPPNGKDDTGTEYRNGSSDRRSSLGQAGARSLVSLAAQVRAGSSADYETNSSGNMNNGNVLPGRHSDIHNPSKASYAAELQRQMEERQAAKLREKVEALQPGHVPHGREVTRNEYPTSKVAILNALQQQQQSYGPPPTNNNYSSHYSMNHQPPPPPYASVPALSPPAPQYPSSLPNDHYHRSGVPSHHASLSPPPPFAQPTVSSSNDAQRRADYAAELERQMQEKKARKEAEKRFAFEADKQTERDAKAYAQLQAARKAIGGAGEPLRDAEGHIVATRGSRSNVATLPSSVAPSLSPSRGGHGYDYPSVPGHRTPPHNNNAHLWEPMEGGNDPHGTENGRPSITIPSYNNQNHVRPVPQDLRPGLSPDQQVRRNRLQMETAAALAAQIEEREHRKAEEAARLKAEEELEEARIARERADLAVRFDREERERKEKEEEEHRQALAAQIEAKARQRELEEAAEREAETRANARLTRQQRELAEQLDREKQGENGPPNPLHNPSNGSDGINQYSPHSLSPGRYGNSNLPPQERRPIGAVWKQELFGPPSPPPFPGDRTLADRVMDRRAHPPPPSSFPSTTSDSFFPISSNRPSSSSYPISTSPRFPPVGPTTTTMDPLVQQRITQTEAELAKLRNAMAVMQLANADTAFVQGLERMGLALPYKNSHPSNASVHRNGIAGNEDPLVSVFQGIPPTKPLSQYHDPNYYMNDNLEASLRGSSNLLPSTSTLDSMDNTVLPTRAVSWSNEPLSYPPVPSVKSSMVPAAVQRPTIAVESMDSKGRNHPQVKSPLVMADPLHLFPEVNQLLNPSVDQRPDSVQSIRGESRFLRPSSRTGQFEVVDTLNSGGAGQKYEKRTQQEGNSKYSKRNLEMVPEQTQEWDISHRSPNEEEYGSNNAYLDESEDNLNNSFLGLTKSLNNRYDISNTDSRTNIPVIVGSPYGSQLSYPPIKDVSSVPPSSNINYGNTLSPTFVAQQIDDLLEGKPKASTLSSMAPNGGLDRSLQEQNALDATFAPPDFLRVSQALQQSPAMKQQSLSLVDQEPITSSVNPPYGAQEYEEYPILAVNKQLPLKSNSVYTAVNNSSRPSTSVPAPKTTATSTSSTHTTSQNPPVTNTEDELRLLRKENERAMARLRDLEVLSSATSVSPSSRISPSPRKKDYSRGKSSDLSAPLAHDYDDNLSHFTSVTEQWERLGGRPSSRTVNKDKEQQQQQQRPSTADSTVSETPTELHPSVRYRHIIDEKLGELKPSHGSLPSKGIKSTTVVLPKERRTKLEKIQESDVLSSVQGSPSSHGNPQRKHNPYGSFHVRHDEDDNNYDDDEGDENDGGKRNDRYRPSSEAEYYSKERRSKEPRNYDIDRVRSRDTREIQHRSSSNHRRNDRHSDYDNEHSRSPSSSPRSYRRYTKDSDDDHPSYRGHRNPPRRSRNDEDNDERVYRRPTYIDKEEEYRSRSRDRSSSSSSRQYKHNDHYRYHQERDDDQRRREHHYRYDSDDSYNPSYKPPVPKKEKDTYRSLSSSRRRNAYEDDENNHNREYPSRQDRHNSRDRSKPPPRSSSRSPPPVDSSPSPTRKREEGRKVSKGSSSRPDHKVVTNKWKHNDSFNDSSIDSTNPSKKDFQGSSSIPTKIIQPIVLQIDTGASKRAVNDLNNKKSNRLSSSSNWM